MSLSPEEVAGLRFNLMPSLGPRDRLFLKEHFGSFEKAMKEAAPSWECFLGIGESDRHIFQMDYEASEKLLEKELFVIEKENIQVHVAGEKNYPELLSHISSPPHLITTKGDQFDWSRPAVAVVGSRRCSFYGEKVARRLACALAEAGVVIVSGMARGIDSHAHGAALEAGGQTWAILGSGLSCLYPPESKPLAAALMKSGVLISEFPLETKPFPGNFPRRNRIIAGLALATIVVEGGEKSGSLITARLAAEEGRDVYAVPGPITSSGSTGPHRLIQMGAKLLHRVEEVLVDFPDDIRSKLTIKIPSITEIAPPDSYKLLLEKLSDIPLPRESLASQIPMAAPALTALLFQMEMEGFIRTLPGGLLVKMV